MLRCAERPAVWFRCVQIGRFFCGCCCCFLLAFFAAFSGCGFSEGAFSGGFDFRRSAIIVLYWLCFVLIFYIGAASFLRGF